MEVKRTILAVAFTALTLSMAQAQEDSQTLEKQGGSSADTLDLPAATTGMCQLPMVADMELLTHTNGTVSVPVKFGDQPGQMLVDTGAVMSVITDTLAIRQRLMGFTLGRGRFELMGGVKMTTLAQVPRFSLGNMDAGGAMLLVAPYTAIGRDISGILGVDIMAHYDVELDFAAAKFRLFARGHCPQHVVYWTRDPIAAVPFTRDADNHMRIEITLDGKPMLAAVDTGAERSTMTMDDFEEIFGYQAKRDLKTIEQVSVNGTERTTIYRFPFQAMTFEGIQVQNPNIDILDGDRFDPGEPKLILGIETLRQLHMFIANGEQRLYLTSAEAR